VFDITSDEGDVVLKKVWTITPKSGCVCVKRIIFPEIGLLVELCVM
jgi:hypothetical protein